MPFACVLEAAVAVAVAGNVGPAVPDRAAPSGSRDRRSFRREHRSPRRRVCDRVVRPGRELVLAAVLRPGIAASLRRHLEAEAGIGDHVDPRRRRQPAGIEDRHIFPAILVKAAKAVEELEAAAADRSRDAGSEGPGRGAGI